MDAGRTERRRESKYIPPFPPREPCLGWYVLT